MDVQILPDGRSKRAWDGGVTLRRSSLNVKNPPEEKEGEPREGSDAALNGGRSGPR